MTYPKPRAGQRFGEAVAKCSAPDCSEPAKWEDVNGRKWCTPHAMCYRTTETLVPYYARCESWSEIPHVEGWWWDADNEEWIEISSGELSTVIVDVSWRGHWYGPIIIPELPPNDKAAPGDHCKNHIRMVATCPDCHRAMNGDGERDKVYAYKMGYDCGQNGSNTTNCSFSIFSAKENTAEWERGHRDGKAAG